MELLCENTVLTITSMYVLGFIVFFIFNKTEPSKEFYEKYRISKKDILILFFPNQLNRLSLSQKELKRMSYYLLWKWTFLIVMLSAVFTPTTLRGMCF